MRRDVEEVWKPMQGELFRAQPGIEKEALKLYKENAVKARKYLTDYSIKWATRAVEEAWKLGDLLWNRYDEQF